MLGLILFFDISGCDVVGDIHSGVVRHDLFVFIIIATTYLKKLTELIVQIF